MGVACVHVDPIFLASRYLCCAGCSCGDSGSPWLARPPLRLQRTINFHLREAAVRGRDGEEEVGWGTCKCECPQNGWVGQLAICRQGPAVLPPCLPPASVGSVGTWHSIGLCCGHCQARWCWMGIRHVQQHGLLRTSKTKMLDYYWEPKLALKVSSDWVSEEYRVAITSKNEEIFVKTNN